MSQTMTRCPGGAEPTTGSRRDTGEAGTLAVALAAEFAAPVGLLDPETGAWRAFRGRPVEEFPGPEEAGPIAATVLGPEGSGGVALWRSEATALEPEPGEPTWLVLPVARPDGEPLAGFVGFASGPGAEGWGTPCPERALRAWGSAVAERLQAEADAAGPGVPPATLADRLIRRLRVSDPPDRFQGLAAEGLRQALGVAAVAWVPCHPRERVVVSGEVAGLGPESFRALLPEAAEESIRVVNQPAGSRPAPLRRAVVVASDGEAPAGWFVAVNPMADRPFTPRDVRLLQPVASLVGSQQSNARLYSDLKELLFGVIRALTSAIDAKDPYTSGHSERVARIAVRLGEALGMTPNQRGDLYLMGLLHDIGKIGIDDGVLKKPGRLTDEEYRQIQSHVRIGVHILSDLKKLNHLLPGVAHHHESFDGTGYPAGLAGEEIPLAARILAVADAFDAMSSTRPYRRRMTSAQIDENFRRGAGVQWDSRVVDALFACRADLDRIRQKGLGESLHQVVDETLGRR